MAIRLFLEYSNRLIQFPVNPTELTILTEADNSVKKIISLGEINLLGYPSLREVKIECFLPSTQNPPYVVTKGDFKPPQFYIDFIEKIITDKKPARFIVSGTKINYEVSIESFEYTQAWGSDDIQYVLKLKEFKVHSAKTVVIKQPTPTTPPKASVNPAPRTPKAFAIGDTVICNGRYWASSYGDKPFGTFKDFTGKIHLIVNSKNRKYRYHITTPQGNWRGWVNESQIRHA